MDNMKFSKKVLKSFTWIKIIALFLLFISISMLSACKTVEKTGIIVAGSTSVQPYAELLAEEYANLNTGSEIDVQGGGSSAGIEAVKSGTANIGMSSRNLKGEENEIWSIEIAKDGLSIIVHKDNPINDLTLEQIRDIYTKKISNWKEISGNDANIHIITREEGSGTRSAFEELVMDDNQITPKAIVQDSNGAVRQLVADDINSIGFISMGLVDETIKALSLDGVEATQENIENNEYVLYRSFLFVADGAPKGSTKDFIDYILSPEGQKLLVREGLIPAAEGETE